MANKKIKKSNKKIVIITSFNKMLDEVEDTSINQLLRELELDKGDFVKAFKREVLNKAVEILIDNTAKFLVENLNDKRWAGEKLSDEFIITVEEPEKK